MSLCVCVCAEKRYKSYDATHQLTILRTSVVDLPLYSFVQQCRRDLNQCGATALGSTTTAGKDPAPAPAGMNKDSKTILRHRTTILLRMRRRTTTMTGAP